MQTIEYIIKASEYTAFAYFSMSCLYVFVFAVAGHFYTKREVVKNSIENKIAVLIPAYKEDAVVVEVAKSALQQKYHSDMFDVVIIADSLQQETLKQLSKISVKVVEVSFEKSTKSKALNAAMETIDSNYDYAVVLDADNIMEDDFLYKMNIAFNNGFQIVQGHRKAKNMNTSFAILDAASEEINNQIFRKGHSTFGLSSGLIGSGMGFDYTLFKTMMKSVKAIGGFDKELEFKFAEKKITIEYLQDAIVLDEKIEKSEDFSNQRRRWLSTQFVYLHRYFRKSWKELFLNGNINFFDKVWQLTIPPRILLLGITFLVVIIYFFLVFGFGFKTNVPFSLWLANLLIVVSAFLLALPRSFYNSNTLKAILSLPTAFFTMFMLLFKLKGANKNFIHTKHSALKN